MLPELLLHGKAGAGKDAVAAILRQNHGAVALAMADPMKRLARRLFPFTDESLWGDSSLRSIPEPRFAPRDGKPSAEWEIVLHMTDQAGSGSGSTDDWVREVFPGNLRQAAWRRLAQWARDLADMPGTISPRVVLQTLGTEMGRKVDQNVWINHARHLQRKLLGGGFMYDRTVGLRGAPGQRCDLAVVTDGRFRNEALEFKAGGATLIRVVDPGVTRVDASNGVPGHQSEQEQDAIPDAWFDAVLYNDKSDGLTALSAAVDRIMHLVPRSLGIYFYT